MNAPITSPERTIPTAMIEILSLALETGIDGVSLGFGSLGADFAAPIEWQLHLERVDHFRASEINGERNYLNVTMQIGSDGPTAYVGPHTSDDPYWYTDEIRSWITTARHDEKGQLLPEYTAAEKARFAQDTELFITSINNGWEAARSLRRQDAVSFARYFPGDKESQIIVNRQFSALNWFYNEESHPAHRDNGTKISQTVHLGYQSPDAALPFFALLEGTDINADTALALPLSPSLWFAPVAFYDEASEEWVR